VTAISDAQQIETVAHKWEVHSKVDKTTFRREVQDFCARYPVYRLVEYTPASIAIGTRSEYCMVVFIYFS